MDAIPQIKPFPQAATPGQTRPFIIGLTMAGAVSAGAYSAGVLDFLFESLGEWQAAKDRGDPTAPKHEVVIAAMSGASAGGISGALCLISAAGGLRPDTEPRSPAAGKPTGTPGEGIRRVLPELYDAWVKGPRLFAPAGKDGKPVASFLGVDDLGTAKRTVDLVSLLDSGPLQQIAERALASVKPANRKYRFFTDPVHLFLTVTNLDGIPYLIPFDGGGHEMTSHADVIHYAMKGLSDTPFPDKDCGWLASWRDAGHPIDLTKPLDPKGRDGSAFIQAVLATSAFPFALRPREIMRSSTAYETRAWPIEESDRSNQDIRPNWPVNGGGPTTFDTYCVAVDGGATDNQPFEYARWAIRDMKDDRNRRDPKTADRAVIMIDPFGTPKPYDVAPISKTRGGDLVLLHVLKTLVPALTDQSRFKLSDLMHANDPNTYSRFLIAPSRTLDHVRTDPALASGLLEAFGGFLDQRFREHDFELGRRNCQSFLRKHFVLHWQNPLFNGDTNWTPFAGATGGDEDLRPIIPLMPSVDKSIAEPKWPRVEPERIADFQRALAGRLDRLAYRLINDSVPVPLWNFAVRVGWRFKRRQVTAHLAALLESMLLRSQQLELADNCASPEPKPTTPHQFAVLAALTDPNWDLRTADGIVREYERVTNLGANNRPATTEPFNKDSVDAIMKTLGPMVVTAKRGGGKPVAYTLRKRQPRLASLWTRWLMRVSNLTCDDDELKRV